MKTKIKLLSLSLLSCIFFSGCSSNADITKTTLNSIPSNKEYVSFYNENYDFTVTAKDTWKPNPQNEVYNLQLFNASIGYFSVMAYNGIDLIEELNSADALLKYHMEDLMSRRDNVEIIEDMTKTEYDDKIVYSCIYSAEKDFSKNYYYSFGIELTENGDIIWVLSTGLPSTILENRGEIEQMVEMLAAGNNGVAVQ